MIKLFMIKLIKNISLIFGKGRRYDIYASRKYRIMWYMIPKNASRTIRYHMEIACPDFVFIGRIPILRFLWKDYIKFAVLRDDEERYASAYRDKVLNRKIWTHDEYVAEMKKEPGNRDHHLIPQRFLYDKDYVDILVHVNELEYLFRQLNINIWKLEHINRTREEAC